MNNNILPLFAATGLIEGNQTRFRTIEKKVIVEVPHELLKQLYDLCNGKNNLGNIISKLKPKWDMDSLVGLLEELFKQKVLVDGRDIQESTWRVVQNPQPYPKSVTKKVVWQLIKEAQQFHQSNIDLRSFSITANPINELLLNRKSVRAFKNEPIEIQSLVNILWSSYGQIGTTFDDEGILHRRTVPSAGALYPLIINVVIFQDSEEIMAGVYRVHFGNTQDVSFELISKDTLSFVRGFINPLMIENAAGAVVISGSIHKSGLKYGNRAMLYVPVEVGHVAQNICLAAQIENVSTVEIGGFVEELIADSIQLLEGYQPFITIVFGQEATENEASKDELEIEWVIPMAGSYKPGFVIAQAKVSSELLDDWSYGRDVSPKLAKVKALAEAREWAAAGCIPDNLVFAKYHELPTAIDPVSILGFHSCQFDLENFPFKPFNESAEYGWVEATDYVSGQVMHILGDQVYFPYWTEHPTLYGFANSSGCAAHITEQLAIETGTMELIERDAFMNSYLNRLERPRILLESLPSNLQSRLRDLENIGFKVWIMDHSLDLAPVAFVFAQNHELKFMSCASSANFNPILAISHALMEVEASVLARLQNGSTKEIHFSEVRSPADHGALYDQENYFERANFMVINSKEIQGDQLGFGLAKSWEALIRRLVSKDLKLFTVPFTIPEEFGGNGGLFISRSIIPGLVPMTFGFQQEPGGMKRIYDIAERYGNNHTIFEGFDLFPHPFA